MTHTYPLAPMAKQPRRTSVENDTRKRMIRGQDLVHVRPRSVSTHLEMHVTIASGLHAHTSAPASPSGFRHMVDGSLHHGDLHINSRIVVETHLARVLHAARHKNTRVVIAVGLAHAHRDTLHTSIPRVVPTGLIHDHHIILDMNPLVAIVAGLAQIRHDTLRVVTAIGLHPPLGQVHDLRKCHAPTRPTTLGENLDILRMPTTNTSLRSLPHLPSLIRSHSRRPSNDGRRCFVGAI